MTEPTTDRQLLWEHVSQSSPRAFEALVQRHGNLVLATAMRQLGIVEAAQEVTQNVFVALARKASRLRVEVNLAGWLHKTAVLESRHWWRDDSRRRRRDQAAVNLGTTMQEEPSLLKSLAPVLDDALLELRATDRQALMLRYFENHSHREVGVLLGISEDAARKRIDKALAQLTRFFQLRGYAVPTVAATASVLSGSVQSAPVSLAPSVTKAALATGSSGSVTAIGLLVARFLGLAPLKVSLAALTICAVPVAYQYHCASTELAQERKLRAELSGLEEEKAGLARMVTQLEGRVRRAEARATGSPGSTTNEVANLYRWEEDSDYVRLPKSMTPEMMFGEAGQWGGPDDQKPVVAKDGTPSPALLGAMGLTAEESQKLSELCRNLVSEYFRLVLPRCYVTNTGRDWTRSGGWGGAPPKEDQSFMRTNRESRTWVMPTLGIEGEMLRQRLAAGLAQCMDLERAAVFFEQTSNKFFWLCNSFGSVERETSVYRASPSTIGTVTEYHGTVHHGVYWWWETPEALQPFVRAWQQPIASGDSPLKQ
jgi:RNA polymerase sigma factor (sigma-70 family)